MNLPKINTTPVKLKSKTVFIDKKVNRFTEIAELNPIPTDVIVYKTLAGLGATYSEIKAQRNSIIIMPNVATILSKHKQHKDIDNTFAVYEGITKDDLKAYLKQSTGFKKILTTPEGFINKVKQILEDSMYADYFLLLDECHKLIRDAGFRKSIIKPLDDFFRFRKKAMISATPITPSDIRFKAHNFTFVKIRPLFKHKQEIEVVKVYDAAEEVMQQIVQDENRTFFIFFDSIAGIQNVMSLIEKSYSNEKVVKDCRIFCSKESCKELKKAGSAYAAEYYSPGAKLNFLTSSFYNGLDIYYSGEDVRIIMVSDLPNASHSAIDPDIDGVQILGRFRAFENPKTRQLNHWVKSFTHVVRTNNKICKNGSVDVLGRIKENQKGYYMLETFKNSSLLKEVKDDFTQYQSRMFPYANLLNEDQTINSYKLDNYLYEELLQTNYRNKETLAKCYLNSKRFNFKRSLTFKEERPKNIYPKGNRRYSVENYIEVINSLWDCEGEPTGAFQRATVTRLFNEFELIVRAYFTLGPGLIEELYFNHKLVVQVLTHCEGLTGRNKQPVIDEVLSSFFIGKSYFLPEAKIKLQEIMDSYDVNIRADAQDLSNYFDVRLVYRLKKDDQGEKTRQKALHILRPKFNQHYARS